MIGWLVGQLVGNTCCRTSW